MLERVKSSDAGRTLGTATNDVINKIKASTFGASVLIVQAKESIAGISVTANAG